MFTQLPSSRVRSQISVCLTPRRLQFPAASQGPRPEQLAEALLRGKRRSGTSRTGMDVLQEELEKLGLSPSLPLTSCRFLREPLASGSSSIKWISKVCGRDWKKESTS